MRHPIELKERAFRLRKKGFSIKEIAKKLSIAKSTSSVWLRSVYLNKKALKRLEKRQLLGYYKSQLIKQKKRERLFNRLSIQSKKKLKQIKFNKHFYQILCALMFWCEGNKTDTTCVRFTNSDPKMIFCFLELLRKSFNLEEEKFRALLHLHEYHNEKKQKKYWSIITNIPLVQFNNTYLKPNTKKRIRPSYPGCIAISYFDAKIAKKLYSLYNTFAKYLGA